MSTQDIINDWNNGIEPYTHDKPRSCETYAEWQFRTKVPDNGYSLAEYRRMINEN